MRDRDLITAFLAAVAATLCFAAAGWHIHLDNKPLGVVFALAALAVAFGGVKLALRKLTE